MDSPSQPTDHHGAEPAPLADEPEPGTSTDAPRGSKQTSIRIGAVVAVALAAAFGVWLLVGDDDSPSSVPTQTVTTGATTPSTTTPADASPPVATSESDLQALAVKGTTVYWAGPAEGGTTLTLLQDPSGSLYVRYLPAGVSVTDPIPPSLVVATYTLKAALAAVKRAAKAPDSVSIAIADGGTAVYSRSKPTNVYFAYPESNSQVEVYDPSPGRALQLVTSGAVTTVTP